MPSNNDKYKDHPLVKEAIAIRELHLKFKDLLHKEGVHHQTKIPTRKEMISGGTEYTKAKEDAIRLAKAKDKKDTKALGKSSTDAKMHVVRVDKALSQFLRLKERGLPEDMYSDRLVTSGFTDWVVRSGLQNGKEVLLFKAPGVPYNSAADEFLRLFGDDLRLPGSGPTIKVGQIDPSTGQPALTEIKTVVLDKDGKQVNPFNMNKHMFIFASHYPQVPKIKEGKCEMGREVIPEADYPHVYDIIKQEHALFTGQLKTLRNNFKDAQDELKKLQEKKNKAIEVGDRTITDYINQATNKLRVARQAYLSILQQNRITHLISPY